MEKSKIKFTVYSSIAVAAVLVIIILITVFKNNKDYLTEISSSNGTSSESSSIASSINSLSSSSVSEVAVKNIIKYTGDEFADAEIFVKRTYELVFIFGIDNFDDANKLPVSQIVQYAFCHLYYDNITEMPDNDKMIFREVLEASIIGKLKEHFGNITIDVKKSDLYNSETKTFQMWEPKLTQNIYSDTEIKKIADNKYELNETFYTDSYKTVIRKKVTTTVKNENNQYYIVGISTK